jgi:hypothetical protein
MNMNKFMIFSKDVNLIKGDLTKRNSLVELFKKNSQYCRDMGF